MFCPIIQIFPDVVSHFANSEGNIILDVDSGTDISLSDKLEKGDVLLVENLPLEITVTIPNTPKNFFYLKTFFDPNTEKANSDTMQVRLTTGSTQYPYTKIQGVRKNKATFEMKLIYPDNWIQQLKDKKLNSLPFEDIEFTEENIIDKWANNKMYVDGDNGYWFPLVNYGNWLVPERRLVVEDFRPFYHALYVLQLMFKEIGWCIESPFYETYFGRSLITYILKGDYNSNKELIPLRTFAEKKEILLASFGNNPQLQDWDELSDIGNNFDEATGILSTPFTGKLIIDFLYTRDIVGIDLDIDLFFRFEIQKGIIPNAISIYNETFTLTNNVPNRVEIEINLLADEELRFFIRNIGSFHVSSVLTITLTNEVDDAIHSKGDTLHMQDEVDKFRTCWEYFSGLQHLINGIVDADHVTKTVRLLTPYNADIFGQSITGYFNSTLTDLISNQPLDSAISVLTNLDKLRFQFIGFKETIDPALKEKVNANGVELFGKLIDLGVSYKSGDAEPNRNPIFEGTILKNTKLPWYGELIWSDSVAIPTMTDNEEGRITSNVNPRILYAAGLGYQANSIPEYIFEDSLLQDIPFAYQDHNNIIFNGTALVERLIYGEDVNDLWTLVYGKFFIQLMNRININFLAYLNPYEYETMSLKNIFQIEYDGHPITGRIIERNDYKPCKVISTQLLLLPEVTTENYCVDTPPIAVCANSPVINTLIVGSCYTFSIGGTFQCAITSITWEKKIGMGAWEAAGTGNTIELCDISETFIVRATIVYDCDECPDDVRTKSINPCNNTASCSVEVFTNELGQTCLQWSFISQFNSDYVLVLELNGEVLDSPYLFCGALPDTDYEFIATFTFENGCEDLVLICNATTDSPTCNNNPILNCVPIMVGGATCFIFTLSGSQTSEVQAYIVTYTCNGVTSQWMIGDPPVCCSGVLTASAIVFYCDCDEVCTPEIQCDPMGCTVVNAGTPILYIVCN